MKKTAALILFFLIHIHCDNSPTLSQPQNTSPPLKNHTIILDTELKRGETITVSFSPLYADNIIYSTKLLRRGDCLEMNSDYFNAITITSGGEELCDNVDATQKQYCFGRQVKILSDREGLYIENSSLDPSYNNCKAFATEELKRRMEDLRTCIQEFSRYDPNKIPLSESESIRKRKNCVTKARGDR